MAAGFEIRVDGTDSNRVEISGQTGTTLEVAEDTYSNSMFQCMATAGEESIFSDVATVTFNIPAASK